MRIADVRPIALAAPVDQAAGMSFGRMSQRQTVIVEVETDQGVTGIGESWINWPGWGLYERVATIIHGIRPLLVGKDPCNINGLCELLRSRLRGVGRQWGAAGIISQAISGVEIALWDLQGRVLGVPVWRLLGGTERREVEVYASGLGPDRPEAAVAECVSRGFQAVKLRVGFGEETDRKNLDAVRSAVGDDITVMVDANCAWSVSEAVIRCKEFRDKFNVALVEEPVAGDDIEALAQVRGALSGIVPVAAGENVYGARAFCRLLESRAVDVVQPDITKVGGFTEQKIICSLASSYGVPYMPHFFGSAVGLSATLHAFAAIPGGVMVEWDVTPNPLREELTIPRLELVGGRVELPQGPGLGVELDADVVNRYKVDIAIA